MKCASDEKSRERSGGCASVQVIPQIRDEGGLVVNVKIGLATVLSRDLDDGWKGLRERDVVRQEGGLWDLGARGWRDLIGVPIWAAQELVGQVAYGLRDVTPETRARTEE